MSPPKKQHSWSRRRQRLGLLVALVPLILVVGFDVSLRGQRMLGFSLLDWLTYALAALEGAALWGVLLYVAARRRGAVRWLAGALFLVLLPLCLGGQKYFFDQYSAYMNVDVSVFATNFTESIAGQLLADSGNFLQTLAWLTLASLVVLVPTIYLLRPRQTGARRAARLLPIVLLGAFFLPTSFRDLQAATPDVLYLHAMGGVIRTHLGLTKQSGQTRPRARESLPVGPITRADVPARNVVFVILESVRKDAVCVDYDANCKLTEATNRLFKERQGLHQVRSLDSATAISLSVLWTGVGPHETREVMHTWPTLFDYARQTGYFTAYWTSQSMMFGNVRLWIQNLGVDSLFTGTEVDPTADIDLGCPESLFADRAISEIPVLQEPFFLAIQLSNGHYPYLVDEAGPQPFQPSKETKAPKQNHAFKNFYQNAIYQQDQHLARVLSELKKQPYSERTVFVVTSDHGEAFREHHQLGHTLSIYDEEVHVPTWVSAPEGTLTEAERTRLGEFENEFVFHPDLTATILDLLGAWQSPEVDRYKHKMLGDSLLGNERTWRALPMTNCAQVWSCGFENWGYIRREKKLEARPWDPDFHCFDLEKDPGEKESLGWRGCGDLKTRALETFGRLPGKSRKKK